MFADKLKKKSNTLNRSEYNAMLLIFMTGKSHIND